MTRRTAITPDERIAERVMARQSVGGRMAARLATKQRLAEARAHLRELKATRRQRTKDSHAKVRADLAKIRERTREMRAALRTASKAAGELARYIAPGARVHLSKHHRAALELLSAEHAGLTAIAQADVEEELAHRQGLAPAQTTAQAKARGRRMDARQESDDAVRAELDDFQARIFDRLKSQRGGFRRGKGARTAKVSRAEEFLEWLGNHPHAINEQHRLDEALNEAEVLAAEERHYATRAEAEGSSGTPDEGDPWDADAYDTTEYEPGDEGGYPDPTDARPARLERGRLSRRPTPRARIDVSDLVRLRAPSTAPARLERGRLSRRPTPRARIDARDLLQLERPERPELPEPYRQRPGYVSAEQLEDAVRARLDAHRADMSTHGASREAAASRMRLDANGQMWTGVREARARAAALPPDDEWHIGGRDTQDVLAEEVLAKRLREDYKGAALRKPLNKDERYACTFRWHRLGGLEFRGPEEDAWIGVISAKVRELAEVAQPTARSKSKRAESLLGVTDRKAKPTADELAAARAATRNARENQEMAAAEARRQRAELAALVR
jgi:hypothetical protein